MWDPVASFENILILLSSQLSSLYLEKGVVCLDFFGVISSCLTFCSVNDSCSATHIDDY